jgi:hypothetical protein
MSGFILGGEHCLCHPLIRRDRRTEGKEVDASSCFCVVIRIHATVKAEKKAIMSDPDIALLLFEYLLLKLIFECQIVYGCDN